MRPQPVPILILSSSSSVVCCTLNLSSNLSTVRNISLHHHSHRFSGDLSQRANVVGHWNSIRLFAANLDKPRRHRQTKTFLERLFCVAPRKTHAASLNSALLFSYDHRIYWQYLRLRHFLFGGTCRKWHQFSVQRECLSIYRRRRVNQAKLKKLELNLICS